MPFPLGFPSKSRQVVGNSSKTAQSTETGSPAPERAGWSIPVGFNVNHFAMGLDLSSVSVQAAGQDAPRGQPKGALVDPKLARSASHAQSPATGAQHEGMAGMTSSVLFRQMAAMTATRGTESVKRTPERLPATQAVLLPESVKPTLPDTTFKHAAATTSHSFPARHSPPSKRPRGRPRKKRVHGVGDSIGYSNAESAVPSSSPQVTCVSRSQ